MEGADAMVLINRVLDVAPLVEVQDPNDKDKSTMEARSSIYRHIQEYLAKHRNAKLIDQATIVGDNLSDLIDIVEV